MEGSALHQALKALCLNTDWNYAVFWKPDRHARIYVEIEVLISDGVRIIANGCVVITSNMMLQNRYLAAFLIFAAANLALTLFAFLITSLIAPETAGSGIPEVKAYLNGVDAPVIFSFRSLVIKIVGSIAAVSSSLNVGKAGSMVHTGACIAALTCQGGSQKYGLTWRWFRFFNNDRDRRDLVTCGSAAGIAAAFRAPVGGVLFALEEMASWWRSALFWRAFFSTAVKTKNRVLPPSGGRG